MIAFVFASALAVFYAACLDRCWREARWWFPLLAGISLGGIVWVNTLAVVPAGLATLLVSWSCRRAWQSGWAWLRVCAAFGLALLLVLPWLMALLEFRDLRGYMDLARIPSGWKYLVMDFLSDRRYRFHFDRRALLHVVTVLAAVGTWYAHRRGDAPLVAFGLTALALLVCTYAFACSRFLDQTEPYRYLSSAMLFAFAPAAMGLRWLCEHWRAANAHGRVATLCVGLMFLPSLTGYGFDFAYRWQRPVTGLNVAQRAVAAWLAEHRDRPGRVLCEDPWLGNVLPWYTGQAVIGGTIGDESVLPHRWSGIGAWSVFGETQRRVCRKNDTLDDYLALYNVAFVVAQRPAFTRDMEAMSNAWHAVQRVGGYTVFETDPARLTYVWKAESGHSAVVTAEPNRITVRAAPKGRFVLKYHYLETLRSTKGTTLYSEKLMDDPVPFIGVDNSRGLAQIEIENQY
jgi:hypothetical protein